MSLRFSRLTRPNIRRMTPGEKITEAGISAERLADGDTRYSVNVMVDGERIHRVIGRESEGVTRTQCEEFVARVRTDAREGRLSLPKGRKTRLNFEKAAKLYLTGEKATGAKDRVIKERHLRRHLIAYFGSMRLDRISTFTVEKFKNFMIGKGHSLGHVNRILSTYRHMGNKLAARNLIPDPFPMIKLEDPSNRRERTLSHEEEAALLSEALKDGNPYSWLFVKMGLSTSLRHSEILAARFDGFNPARHRLRVRVKGGDWREQPLTRELCQSLLNEQRMATEPHGWIFPNSRSASGRIMSMKTAFKRCVVRAGLNPSEVVPHTMRHTAITNLVATGADVRTVQEFSGHKSLAMVMRYTHAQDRRVDQAIEAMESAKTNVEQITTSDAKES